MKKIGDPQFFGEMEHFRHSSPLCSGLKKQVQNLTKVAIVAVAKKRGTKFNTKWQLVSVVAVNKKYNMVFFLEWL